MKIPFSKQLLSLPTSIPFVGPETIEREQNIKFKARLGANESAFGISPHAEKAIKDASPITYYGDPTNFNLRTELSKVHGVSMDRILVGGGIDGLFSLLAQAFIEPGTPVTTSKGSYPTFNYFMTLFGATLNQVPYKGFAPDLDALVHESRLIYLANPDNPTGFFHTKPAVKALCEKIPQNGMLILDEAYLDFAPSEENLPLGDEGPHVIRMRTFSKAHGMAGMRIGYLIADEEVVAGLNKIRNQFQVSRLAQIAALASLKDPAFIESVIAKVAAGRGEYYALGEKLGLKTLPSSTNFVSFDLETPERVASMMEALKGKGIFVRTGPPPNNRLLRVSVGSPSERALFAAALNSLHDDRSANLQKRA